MAGKSAVLTVKILSDASQAGKGVDQATGKFDKFQSGLAKANKVAMGVAAGLIGLGTVAVKSASELEQAQGAVESIYGKSAAAVDKYAQTSVDRLGLSEAAYKNYSALVGASLQNAGFSAQKAAGMSDKAMVRAADMASTYGGTTSDAIDAINAAVSRGEFDPLEKYAISLNKTAVDAELARRGQDKLTGAAKKQATTQATLDLIYKNSSKSAGQFARESDTVAGQQQRATAAFENASATIGTALLPVVATLAQKLAEVATWIGNNSRLVLTLAGVLGGLATAVMAVNAAVKLVTAAMKVYQVTVTVVTAVTKALGIAAKVSWRAMLGPMGLVIAAIGVVIGIVVLLWNKFPPFRKAVIAVWRGIANVAKATWRGIKAVISAVVGWAKAFIRGFGNVVKTVWRAIANVAKATWRGIKAVVSGVIGVLKTIIRGFANVAKAVFKTIKAVATTAWRGIKAVVGAVVGGIKALVRGLKSAVNAVWNGIKSVATTVWNAIKSVVSNTVNSIKTVLNGVKTAATRVWNAVKSAATTAFNAILKPVNAVKDAIDKVISVVKSAIEWIGKIKIPKIPGLGALSKLMAPAPAPAYRPAPAYQAAPTLPGISRRRVGATDVTGGTAPVIININGTLHDADAAAAVRRVLRNDQRRRGGVVIERRRQAAIG